MKSIGNVIRESRKSKGIHGDALGHAIGLSKNMISLIERDALKGGPDPEVVVRISEALGDRNILTSYLENNPVYRSIIPKIFPDLNNIRRDPAIIFTRFAAEAREAEQAALILAEVFSNADPSTTPNFCEVLKSNLEQIVDVQRCAEILFLQLIESRVITDADRCEVHARQQQKCISKGHHKAEAA